MAAPTETKPAIPPPRPSVYENAPGYEFVRTLIVPEGFLDPRIAQRMGMPNRAIWINMVAGQYRRAGDIDVPCFSLIESREKRDGAKWLLREFNVSSLLRPNFALQQAGKRPMRELVWVDQFTLMYMVFLNVQVRFLISWNPKRTSLISCRAATLDGGEFSMVIPEEAPDFGITGAIRSKAHEAPGAVKIDQRWMQWIRDIFHCINAMRAGLIKKPGVLTRVNLPKLPYLSADEQRKAIAREQARRTMEAKRAAAKAKAELGAADTTPTTA